MSKLLRTAFLGLATMTTVIALGAPSQAAPYDGTSPVSTGCANTATTPRSAALRDYTGGYWGYIELRYSTGCRTAWARLVSTYGTSCVPGDDGCGTGTVHRNSDGLEYTCTTPSGSKTCYSRQVNDANVTSYARGYLTVGPLNATGQTGSY